MPRAKPPASARITEQQERYCIERAKGRTQLVAYRAAYSNRSNDATAKREAKRIEARAALRQRIAELKIAARNAEQGVKAPATPAEAEVAAPKIAAVEEVRRSRDEVLTELWDNAMQAKAAVPVKDSKGHETGEWVANWAASNAALIAYGKELGMFREGGGEKRSPLENLTPEQLRNLEEWLVAAGFDTPGPTRRGKNSLN